MKKNVGVFKIELEKSLCLLCDNFLVIQVFAFGTWTDLFCAVKKN